MCQKRNSVNAEIDGKNVRVDACMRNLIEFINCETEYETLASCCGHGKYPMSIMIVNEIYKNFDAYPIELFSLRIIHRKKKFYKKDKEGYYYIPEVVG